MTRIGKGAALREHLVEQIGHGLRPHDRLPTERALATQFHTSRMTVRRVLDRLESEGLVYRVQGSGTFVAETAITKTVELTSFSEDMRGRGLSPGSRLLGARERPAGATVGYLLGISPVDPVIEIRRVRTADDEPMCLEEACLPAAFVPGLMELPLNRSLYETLTTRYRITVERADQTVRATVLDPADAELLQVPPLSPALAVERITYDARGRPIERATSLYRGDRYAYQLTLHRNPDVPIPRPQA